MRIFLVLLIVVLICQDGWTKGGRGRGHGGKGRGKPPKNSRESGSREGGSSESGSSERNDRGYLPPKKRLIKELLRKYERVGKYGRPVLNDNSKLRVEFGLALMQIVEFDTSKKVLTLNAWEKYRWMDEFLRWDPKRYDRVSVVRMPISAIWKPDIYLYNNADDAYRGDKNDGLAVVASVNKTSGQVIWIPPPPTIIKAICSGTTSNDTEDGEVQTCVLKYGSWTMDGYQVDIQFFDNLKNFEMGEFVPSNEWEIVETSAVRNEMRYPCCPEPYPRLEFTLKLRRRS